MALEAGMCFSMLKIESDIKKINNILSSKKSTTMKNVNDLFFDLFKRINAIKMNYEKLDFQNSRKLQRLLASYSCLENRLNKIQEIATEKEIGMDDKVIISKLAKKTFTQASNKEIGFMDRIFSIVR